MRDPYRTEFVQLNEAIEGFGEKGARVEVPWKVAERWLAQGIAREPDPEPEPPPKRRVVEGSEEETEAEPAEGESLGGLSYADDAAALPVETEDD